LVGEAVMAGADVPIAVLVEVWNVDVRLMAVTEW
jgi:hypothetical protein